VDVGKHHPWGGDDEGSVQAFAVNDLPVQCKRTVLKANMHTRVLQAQLTTVLCTGEQYLSAVLVKYPDAYTQSEPCVAVFANCLSFNQDASSGICEMYKCLLILSYTALDTENLTLPK
jgi:hypothetical protein